MYKAKKTLTNAAHLEVLVAVVGRIRHEHHILGGGYPVLGVPDLQLSSLVHHHLSRFVVLLFQQVSCPFMKIICVYKGMVSYKKVS